jgi:hypothetical protein
MTYEAEDEESQLLGRGSRVRNRTNEFCGKEIDAKGCHANRKHVSGDA